MPPRIQYHDPRRYKTPAPKVVSGDKVRICSDNTVFEGKVKNVITESLMVVEVQPQHDVAHGPKACSWCRGDRHDLIDTGWSVRRVEEACRVCRPGPYRYI